MVHLAQKPVCTAGYVLKKILQAVSPYKHISNAAPELTVITDDSITQWESAPQTSEGTRGLRGVWEAEGGLFEVHGFMDGWIHGCEGKRMH